MEQTSDGREERREIILPKQLEEVEAATEFPHERHRWNTNEEIASILLAFSKHKHWQLGQVRTRPANGSMLIYSRKHVRYRQDGYCWKKRKDGRTTREDHMKLKVRGVECIYGCYVHSAVLPTFHRRCYWLLQNRDLVLVHYLNMPNTDDNKDALLPTLVNCPEKKEWSKQELFDQLRPMYSPSKLETDSVSPYEAMSDDMLQAIVNHVLETQQQKSRLKTHECLCRSSLGGSTIHAPECTHTKCRIISPKGSQAGVSASIIQNRLLELIQKNKKENGARMTQGSNVVNKPTTCTTNPLILNLSQVPSGNGLIILNGQHTMPISIINSDGSVFRPGNKSTGLSIQPTLHNSCDKLTSSGQAVMNRQVNKPSLTTDKPLIGQTGSFDEQNNLQLSADELQQTLAANLPSFSKSSSEFSSNHNHTTTATPSPQSAEFNLDAFDILDLPDFDINLNGVEEMQTHSSHSDTIQQVSVARGRQQHCLVDKESETGNMPKQAIGVKQEMPEGIANITDFSPEWSFTDGATKLLIIGPWYSTTSPYTCLFDDQAVPAVLVQNGVLRTFAPAHSPALVTLRVACEGQVISSACVFEYKLKSCIQENKQQAWLVADRNQLQSGLLQRLRCLEECLGSPSPSVNHFHTQQSQEKVLSPDPFENKVIHLCNGMKVRSWVKMDELSRRGLFKGMTLLHYAAALGYDTFISTLIRWRSEKPSVALECEVDALSVDDNRSTPILWSCGLGKNMATRVLYDWNPRALQVCDKDGFTPISVARSHGFLDLAQSLEDLDNTSSCHLLPLSPGVHPTSCVRSESMGCMSTPMLESSLNSSVSTGQTDSSVSDYSFNTPHSGCGEITNLSIDIPPQTFSSRQSTPPTGIVKNTRRKRGQLMKQFSVDPALEGATSAMSQSLEESKNLRLVNSDPHLNLMDKFPSSGKNISMLDTQTHSDTHTSSARVFDNSMSPYFVVDDLPNFGSHQNLTDQRKVAVAMETDDPRCGSPYIDVETVSDEEAQAPSSEKMVNLATQIIAAIPERIKLSPSRSDDFDIPRGRERSSSRSSFSSYCSSVHTPPQALADDSGISTPMGDNSAFDEARYPDLGTPTSCHSPGSPRIASSYCFTMDSPPPTKEDFREYFNAPAMFLEQDFSLLTLSDQEQRNLFEAAKIIQDAFRQYKTKLQNKMNKEREVKAAVLIQSYYRRYKQYEYFKKMSEAAVTIQSQFRTYYAQKRFKKSQDAARIIQNQYRTYKEHERFKRSRNAAVIIQQRFRTHYQRKRNLERNKSLPGSSSQRESVCGIPPSQTTESEAIHEQVTIKNPENQADLTQPTHIKSKSDNGSG